MRFVFLSYNYSPDIFSPEEWTERIKFYVGSLEVLSMKHSVIRVDQINYTGNFIYNGVQYFCVDEGKKKNYFPRNLNRFVKKLNPDVVVVSSFLFPLQVLQLRSCLGKKIKIIVQHHAEKPYTGTRKLIQKMASRLIDAYIFASFEIGAEWVKNGNLVDEKKIHEIVGGTSIFYPVEKCIAREKIHIQEEVIFLWAGRFNANKDPITVVKAFLKFARLQPGRKLYMIYQTTELLEEVKQLISATKSNDSIVLVGQVKHLEMLYWFNSADFIISGSHYEGSGTAICEAMSCGCVPIVTDIPSFRAIIAEGKCGFLYEAGNENALFDSLLQTMTPLAQEKQAKALEQFKNNLSFDAIAAKFQELAATL
ncbi:MAG: glycosyltransferase family 4 protein [Ginsengibacter sp.]